MDFEEIRVQKWQLAVAVWWVFSIVASLIPVSHFGPDEIPLTIYYTGFKYLFFPTIFTFYALGEPASTALAAMWVHHLVAVPLYAVVCYMLFKEF